MRRMAMVLTVALVLGGAGLQGLSGGGAPSASAQEAAVPTADDRAHRLRERLGALCRNYDFFYRHAFANGEMRPVRCSRVSRERTIVIVYAFSDRRTKKAWLNEWGQLAKERGAVVLRGKRWVVEVVAGRWAREARARL